MNDYIIKANNYYLKQLRQCVGVQYFEADGAYWLTNGYVVHRIPENFMELNPLIIKEANEDLKNTILSILEDNNSRQYAKETGVVKKQGILTMTAFILESSQLAIWFNKKLVDLFPPYSKIYATEPLQPAIVKRSDEIIGIILPVKAVTEEDIRLFI